MLPKKSSFGFSRSLRLTVITTTPAHKPYHTLCSAVHSPFVHLLNNISFHSPLSCTSASFSTYFSFSNLTSSDSHTWLYPLWHSHPCRHIIAYYTLFFHTPPSASNFSTSVQSNPVSLTFLLLRRRPSSDVKLIASSYLCQNFTHIFSYLFPPKPQRVPPSYRLSFAKHNYPL